MIWCHHCAGEQCHAGKIERCNTTMSCFKSSTLVQHEGQSSVVNKRGCVNDGLTCALHTFQPTLHKKLISQIQVKCCDTNLCNNGSFPELPQNKEQVLPPSEGISPLHIAIAVCGSLVFMSLAVLFYIFVIKKFSRKKIINEKRLENRVCHGDHSNHVEREFLNSDYRPDVKVTAPGDSTLREALIDGSVTSGSGSGYPLLVQRTLAKQIDLIQCIGHGRYGEVWRGDLHYDQVAVKIFYSRDEASWQREVEIYSTIILKNDSILPFIGSDVTSVNSCTQLWLVTTYYPLGSLFDYLNMNALKLDAMFSIMHSIVSGMAHLHTEIFGTQGKPAIAHRDIKSKNILMKNPAECCIADFGLAVTHKQTTDSLNIAMNYRVGTKRYMAPEVLDGTLQENYFQSYTMADIYSLSLVMWEIICRTESETSAALTYNVPYQDMVPSDPSFDEMKNLVCIENRRPDLSSRINDPQLAAVATLIRESWSSPSSRLSALRIKKSLVNIKAMFNDKPQSANLLDTN